MSEQVKTEMSEYRILAQLTRGPDRVSIYELEIADTSDLNDVLVELVRHAEDDDYRNYQIEIRVRPSSRPNSFCDDPTCSSCNGLGADGHIY